jgi:hypothetical protein
VPTPHTKNKKTKNRAPDEVKSVLVYIAYTVSPEITQSVRQAAVWTFNGSENPVVPILKKINKKSFFWMEKNSYAI